LVCCFVDLFFFFESVIKSKYIGLFFEEKPITLENSNLINACMLQQRSSISPSSSTELSTKIEDYDEEDALFDCLSLCNSQSVTSTLDAITRFEEEIQSEMTRNRNPKKGKDIQQMTQYAPSSFRSVLLYNQIHHHAKDLDSFIAQTASKLYLLNQVEKVFIIILKKRFFFFL
jgi:hypothetical protein